MAYHTTFLKKKFKLEVYEKKQETSNIYWTPKFLKRPSKASFIIAAPQCSMKPLHKTASTKFSLKLI